MSSPLLAVVCLLLLRVVTAVPITKQPRAISSTLLNNFALIEQYAAASYCPNNNDSPDTPLTCSTGSCPLVQDAGASTITEFSNPGNLSSLTTDVTGFVAVDTSHRYIVLSFRGSVSLRNYLADINVAMIDTDICDGCQAHSGFWTSWLEARAAVLSAVEEASHAHPGFQIVATGHSLGAAVADLCAAGLRNAGYGVDLYTFGSPYIGAAPISDYIASQPGNTYRITHLNDPVPQWPSPHLGYTHLWPEYYISSPNNVSVGAGDVTVVQQSDASRGNQGQTTTDSNAHGWYFNEIASCYPEGLELKRSF
ncbi:alpha/beta-hydrolase [Aulographum hederae CBS 113979]|uniref:Alpha/beta-hydrolase n=1 Tax=Aulographum hederae CBS 113979 TaxID=1176131 RepID=A0A6G1HHB0_9PEZI|nr:alpha/beta-hydrolase [Aulographum hederae CBS 113979]